MTQKIFLTSALAMGVMAPAFAEMTDSNTFPNASQGEYMQENTRYIGAATAENMDNVYEDGATVNAVAQYTDILYNIVAGNYLAAGSEDENGTQCPQNSYCPGLTDALYNETTDQGINSCSTATNGIYALSAAGASSQNDCYRTCTTADVEHSAGVTGGYYYGNNNQCEPTDCVNGWHKKNGVSLVETIGQGDGENSAYIDANGSFNESNYDDKGSKGSAYYGFASGDTNVWAVDYGSNGMLIGQARCSTVEGVRDFNWSTNQLNQPITTHTTSELGAEGGQYCYCNITGYKGGDGILQNVSSSWAFYGSISGVCSTQCSRSCSIYMRIADSYYSWLRSALLGTVAPTLASCEANTITINWSDASQTDIDANNAGTATYGSDVRTPVKAQTIKGKTFRGWRFSKPEQTNLP